MDEPNEITYYTDGAFKTAIEGKLGLVFSTKSWAAFSEELKRQGVHPSCNEIDVEDAVDTWQRLKVIHDDYFGKKEKE